MSCLSLSAILSQQQDIERMMYDIKNELETSKKSLRDFENKLVQEQQQFELLQQQYQETQTLLNDSYILMKNKQIQIEKDKMYEKKIMYSLRCQQYLTTYSNNHYNFQEMCCDEIISLAQQLHFLQCLHMYFKLNPPTPPNLPNNENDFHHFEKLHNYQDDIYLTSSIFIPLLTWHQITEYNNALPFTIDSDMSSLNLEMYQQLHPSFEIYWTIT